MHMQMEGEGILVQAQNQKLHQELWQRQHEAVVRSQPEAAEAAAAAKQAAIVDLPPLTEQPNWIQQGQLYPHQLQVHSFYFFAQSNFSLSGQFGVRTIYLVTKAVAIKRKHCTLAGQPCFTHGLRCSKQAAFGHACGSPEHVLIRRHASLVKSVCLSQNKVLQF